MEPVSFKHAGVTDAWAAYAGKLTFGKGQTLALLDDGCKLSMPEWTATVDGVPKVLISHDSVDGDDDPKHEGKGYHGSTIGIPSSLNLTNPRSTLAPASIHRHREQRSPGLSRPGYTLR